MRKLIIKSAIEWSWNNLYGQHTVIHRAGRSCICNEYVKATKLSYSGGDCLFCLCHVLHISREDKDLCRGTLAENRVSCCVEACLAACHQCEVGTGVGVLERNLFTDAARCTSDQHDLG